MKIVIPTNSKDGLNAEIAEHFGRAKIFLIYDSETKNFEICLNPEVTGGAELPPDFLRRQGAEAVIAFSLGPKAYEKFKNYNIPIYKPIEGVIADNLQGFEDNKLKKITKDDIF